MCGLFGGPLCWWHARGIYLVLPCPRTSPGGGVFSSGQRFNLCLLTDTADGEDSSHPKSVPLEAESDLHFTLNKGDWSVHLPRGSKKDIRSDAALGTCQSKHYLRGLKSSIPWAREQSARHVQVGVLSRRVRRGGSGGSRIRVVGRSAVVGVVERRSLRGSHST